MRRAFCVTYRGHAPCIAANTNLQSVCNLTDGDEEVHTVEVLNMRRMLLDALQRNLQTPVKCGEVRRYLVLSI